MYYPLTSRVRCATNAFVADSRLYVARPTAALILAAAVALLTAEVLLLRRNGVLQAELAAERRILIPPVGWQLPALHGLAPDGAPEDVRFTAGHRTLVIVTDAGCSECRASRPSWAALVSSLPRSAPRPVVVAMHVGSFPMGSGWLRAAGLGRAIVLTHIGAGEMLASRFLMVPITLAVSPAGRAVGVWLGKLSAGQVQGVLRVLTTESKVRIAMSMVRKLVSGFSANTVGLVVVGVLFAAALGARPSAFGASPQLPGCQAVSCNPANPQPCYQPPSRCYCESPNGEYVCGPPAL